MEEWKIMPDHLNYEVSNLGNFRRITPGQGTKVGKPRKTYINPKTGYRNVTFGKPSQENGKYTRTYSAHRLVAETWIPNPDKLCCVDHINGNRADNRVVNLRWLSYSLNSARKKVIATALKGEEVIHFPSVGTAVKFFNTSSTTLRRHLKHEIPFKGYYIEYFSDKDKQNHTYS